MSKLMSSTLQEPPPSPERPHQPGGEGCVRAAAGRGRAPSQRGLQSAGHTGEAAPAPGQVTAGGVYTGGKEVQPRHQPGVDQGRGRGVPGPVPAPPRARGVDPARSPPPPTVSLLVLEKVPSEGS